MELADRFDEEADAYQKKKHNNPDYNRLNEESKALYAELDAENDRVRNEMTDMIRKKKITSKEEKYQIRTNIRKTSQLDILRVKITNNQEQINEGERVYDKKIAELGKRADELRALAEKFLPPPADVRYVIVTVPQSYLVQFTEDDEMHYGFVESMVEKFEEIGYDADKLWDWMIENGWIMPKDTVPADGLLVGLRLEDSPGKVPFDLIYIYYHRGQFLFTAAGLYREYDSNIVLREQLPEEFDDLSNKEIMDIYHLPFAIRNEFNDDDAGHIVNDHHYGNNGDDEDGNNEGNNDETEGDDDNEGNHDENEDNDE